MSDCMCKHPRPGQNIPIDKLGNCIECGRKVVGVKFDHGKPRWDLLPFDVIEEIVKVLTMGAQKYEDHNWKKIENIPERYFAALMRHMAAWQAGETEDQESGLSHLAHAGCCLTFLLWHEKNTGYRCCDRHMVEIKDDFENSLGYVCKECGKTKEVPGLQIPPNTDSGGNQ